MVDLTEHSRADLKVETTAAPRAAPRADLSDFPKATSSVSKKADASHLQLLVEELASRSEYQ